MKVWKTGQRKEILYKDIFEILKKISDYKNHKVIIGTDSVKMNEHWVFTNAIAIFCEDNRLYDRKYYYLREELSEDYTNLYKRLIKETEDSIQIANDIKSLSDNIKIEIHADVNTDKEHKSYNWSSTVAGYISGCGFEFKLKPESFVASSIADNHTRKK